ncbi:MAG: hypothetical protein PHV28_01220 [Kiritimatiellae bacterium]|nr:hypothetical protein [Kiritimatiellia bacterium]
MKQSVEYNIIQNNMQPGAITRDGMLGHDRRNLRDIIETDDAAVRRLGLTHISIAARMRELRDAGREGLGENVTVSGRFDVRVDSVRGKLPCPFRHEGLFDKEFVEILNRDTGARMTFSTLNIHMIEEHGFYEGLGSPFRLDPDLLASVLGLTPDP